MCSYQPKYLLELQAKPEYSTLVAKARDRFQKWKDEHANDPPWVDPGDTSDDEEAYPTPPGSPQDHNNSAHVLDLTSTDVQSSRPQVRSNYELPSSDPPSEQSHGSDARQQTTTTGLPQQSTITTRSKSAPSTILMELDQSGRSPQIMRRHQRTSHTANSRQPEIPTTSSGTMRSRKRKRQASPAKREGAATIDGGISKKAHKKGGRRLKTPKS